MALVIIIGIIAAILTTICYIPQVIKIWKLKQTKDLSLVMYVLLCLGILLWLIYGILTKDLPIISANIVSLILTLSLISLKLRYG